MVTWSISLINLISKNQEWDIGVKNLNDQRSRESATVPSYLFRFSNHKASCIHPPYHFLTPSKHYLSEHNENTTQQKWPCIDSLTPTQQNTRHWVSWSISNPFSPAFWGLCFLWSYRERSTLLFQLLQAVDILWVDSLPPFLHWLSVLSQFLSPRDTWNWI